MGVVLWDWCARSAVPCHRGLRLTGSMLQSLAMSHLSHATSPVALPAGALHHQELTIHASSLAPRSSSSSTRRREQPHRQRAAEAERGARGRCTTPPRAAPTTTTPPLGRRSGSPRPAAAASALHDRAFPWRFGRFGWGGGHMAELACAAVLRCATCAGAPIPASFTMAIASPRQALNISTQISMSGE
jgi:hypothetical protein